MGSILKSLVGSLGGKIFAVLGGLAGVISLFSGPVSDALGAFLSAHPSVAGFVVAAAAIVDSAISKEKTPPATPPPASK
jgi:hypothetical protein